MSPLAIGLLALVVASGCGGPDRGGLDRSGADREALSPRLARLESRLAALEERLGSFATVDDLDEQIARLERQLAAAAAAPANAVPAVPAPVPLGMGGFPDLPQLKTLNELSAEYNERVAAVQERYADDPSAPERLREMHELRRWFYQQLRTAGDETVAPQ